MSKLKHVTEHDGSRWVELEVAEEMYEMLERLHYETRLVYGEDYDDVEELLTKARGENTESPIVKADTVRETARTLFVSGSTPYIAMMDYADKLKRGELK